MAKSCIDVHRTPGERLTTKVFSAKDPMGYGFYIRVNDSLADGVGWWQMTREDATAIRDGAQALLDMMDADEAAGGDPQ